MYMLILSKFLVVHVWVSKYYMKKDSIICVAKVVCYWNLQSDMKIGQYFLANYMGVLIAQ